MPSYPGKYQYLDENGGALAQGPCELSFEGETCTVAPASGGPLAFDLGDVDRFSPAEWDLELAFYTGRRLRLTHFGPAFGRVCQELMAAWRDRTVQCLLLEDLEEVKRFEGTVARGDGKPVPSEIRIFKSNIAALPVAGETVQWRLADIDCVKFDERAYSITAQSGADRLVVTKLAKKTDAFLAALQETLAALRAQSAAVLRGVFPFLTPDQLQRLVTAMPEGRSVSLASLTAIHPKLADALLARAVDPSLKPYFDALRARAVPGSLMAGFKFTRESDEPEPAEAAPEDMEAPESEAQPDDGEDERPPLFFWFFFPLRNAVAWEASTGGGRATYVFRPAPQESAGQAIERLTRGLALVNFRREPVYLSEEALERNARFRRYAIGCRRLPELRALRASMACRAVHSSLETWTAQLDALLG
jgi:hypothetical protein